MTDGSADRRGCGLRLFVGCATDQIRVRGSDRILTRSKIEPQRRSCASAPMPEYPMKVDDGAGKYDTAKWLAKRRGPQNRWSALLATCCGVKNTGFGRGCFRNHSGVFDDAGLACTGVTRRRTNDRW